MLPVILWVEDNVHDVQLMQTACTEQGLQVDFILADNAMSAFRYLDALPPYDTARRPPDLILIDINLPAINGIVVLSELKRKPQFASVPSVVLSSTSNASELQECRRVGAVECLLKPAVFTGYLEIVDTVRKYLPGSDGRQVPAAALPATAPSESSTPVNAGGAQRLTADAPAVKP